MSFANCSQSFYPFADLLISSSQYPNIFFKVHYFIPTLLHLCRPSDSNVSDDAGIEPRTAATSTLAVRRSKHWAIQYLIHTRLHLTHNSARSHPYPARSHLLYTRLDLIHNSARTHPYPAIASTLGYGSHSHSARSHPSIFFFSFLRWLFIPCASRLTSSV
jgi:hypothetical protein